MWLLLLVLLLVGLATSYEAAVGIALVFVPLLAADTYLAGVGLTYINNHGLPDFASPFMHYFNPGILPGQFAGIYRYRPVAATMLAAGLLTALIQGL